MIHASDILNTMRCPRLGWNVYHHQKGRYEPYANLIAPIRELAAMKLGLQGLPAGKTGDTMERTRQLLQEKRGGVRLRFERDGIRTTIPFLLPVEEEEPAAPSSSTSTLSLPSLTGEAAKPPRKSGKKPGYRDLSYEIVYPFLSPAPSEKELQMMALNDWILEALGIQVVRHRIVFVNRDYVRGEDLDVDELLCIGNRLFHKPGHPFEQTIDEQLTSFDFGSFKEQIDEAIRILQDEKPEAERVRGCLSPRRCLFYEDCFDESEREDDSIHFLSSASKRSEMIEEGISRLSEADPDRIEGFPLQYAQIRAAASEDGQFLDALAAKAWIDALEYPRIYLDFEWDTFAFPPYSGMVPYDVLCFEYSMHVEQEDGTLTHFGFFQAGDCRRAFVETLLERIPETGSVIVYNMEGAEKLRLTQLARQFPEYASKLSQICSRMVDLSVLFEKGVFYDIRQRGHYSLKTMVDVLDDGPGYSRLPIKNGLEAIDAYRKLSKSGDETEIRSLAGRIDEYCAMDTRAEIILLHAISKRLTKAGTPQKPKPRPFAPKEAKPAKKEAENVPAKDSLNREMEQEEE